MRGTLGLENSFGVGVFFFFFLPELVVRRVRKFEGVHIEVANI